MTGMGLMFFSLCRLFPRHRDRNDGRVSKSGAGAYAPHCPLHIAEKELCAGRTPRSEVLFAQNSYSAMGATAKRGRCRITKVETPFSKYSVTDTPFFADSYSLPLMS